MHRNPAPYNEAALAAGQYLDMLADTEMHLPYRPRIYGYVNDFRESGMRIRSQSETSYELSSVRLLTKGGSDYPTPPSPNSETRCWFSKLSSIRFIISCLPTNLGSRSNGMWKMGRERGPREDVAFGTSSEDPVRACAGSLSGWGLSVCLLFIVSTALSAKSPSFSRTVL